MNHSFVTTKKNLTADMLQEMLEEIGKERFGGKLKITREDGSEYVNVHLGTEHRVILFWLASKRTIEIRKQCGGIGDIGFWLESVFCNELAVMLDGNIGNEGVGEKWKGEKGKYPTLESFVRKIHMPFKDSWLKRRAVNRLVAISKRELKEIMPELSSTH